MAYPKLCVAPGCGKPAPWGRHCSMHTARLRRGGSLEPRQQKKTLAELLDGRTTIGAWTVLAEGHPYQRRTTGGCRHKDGVVRTALCRCECGVERALPIQSLKAGHTHHCGCMMPQITAHLKTTHGMCRTAEYRAWAKLKERCSNPNSKDPVYPLDACCPNIW